MSSLSHLPYGKILDYWYESLREQPYQKCRLKFLLTKVIEVFAFKVSGGDEKMRYNYFDFPDPVPNTVPDKPRLSVVVPVHVRTEKHRNDLKNLVQAIGNQRLRPDRVIIVDDCSPLSYTVPDSWRLFRLSQNSGPARARNIGKRLAVENGSDIIAFTDLDCIVSGHWTETIGESFVTHRQFQILSGDTPAFDRGWFGTYHNINGTLNGRRIKNSERLLYGTTANLAITREVAEQIDFNEGFPEAAGEDIEFCFRANERGFAIKYISTMTVQHNYGYTGQFFQDLKLLIEQFKKYGRGEKVLLKEIPNYYAYFDRSEEIKTKQGCART